MTHKPFKSFFASTGVRTAAARPADAAASQASPTADQAPVEPAPPRLRRVVLGYEKRAGDKSVTTVRDVPVEARAAVMADIKRTIGTGGSIAEDVLVIQGDQRARLTAWFESQGVRVAGERR